MLDVGKIAIEKIFCMFLSMYSTPMTMYLTSTENTIVIHT